MTPSSAAVIHPLRARRFAALLLVLGAMGWAAIAVATQRIPSPAREVRFVRNGHAHPAFEVHCHGAFYADGGWLWSQCERTSSGDAARYLARLDVSSGVATLLGPIPYDAYGLLGVARGGGPTRAFVMGSALLSVRGDALQVLGNVGGPLGLAVIDEGVEVVDQAGHPTPVVRRYEAGRLVSTEALPSMPVVVGRHARAEYAVRERDGWHLVYSEHGTTSPTFPIEVTLFEPSAHGEPRRLQTLSLGRPLADREVSGNIFVVPGAIRGGALLESSGVRGEFYVQRGGAFERVVFDAADLYESAGGIVRGDGPLGRLFVSERRHRFWIDGARLEWVGGRSVALRVGGRTGAPLTTSFWVEIAPRVFPREGGGYVIVGGLGQAIVRVGPDLARTDALSFGERLARLFVEDRAKRNDGFFNSGGVLRSLTVPFAMLLPLLGLAGLAAAARRPRLVVGASSVALGLALAAALPFVKVLRFFW